MIDNLSIYGDSENPYFSLRNFAIKLSFNLSETWVVEPETIEKFAEFLHEYTHYLQVFTTINGLSAILQHIETQIKLIFKITTKLIQGNQDLYACIKENKENIETTQNILFWERNPRSHSDNLIPNYFVTEIANPILHMKTNEVFILNIIDHRYYHISTKVLRENMAMMANFYIRGIGSDAIMDHIKIFPSEEKPYSPKYWIIFSYFFYKYPIISNHVIFTFYFCELALMSINSGQMVVNLLSEIDKKLQSGKYTNENDFFILFFNLKSYLYDFFNNLYPLFKSEINKNIDILQQMQVTLNDFIKEKLNEQEYFQSFQVVLELINRGINFKRENGTIFNNRLDNSWVMNKAQVFYSPIILDPKGHTSVIYNDIEYVQRISIVYGISIVTDLIQRDKGIASCPFYSTIPICECDKTGINHICEEDPLNIKPFKDGGCLFYNSCLVLGLLPFEELKKFGLTTAST